MSTIDDLRAAKALIATRETWCRGVIARDADNFTVSPHDPSGCKFCAIGALEKVAKLGLTRPMAVLQAASFEQFLASPEHVNDNIGFEAVHQVYDRAIQMQEHKDKLFGSPQ